jgi:hypothetical protein
MSIKRLECRVSELVNSDTCPRPTTKVREQWKELKLIFNHLSDDDGCVPPSSCLASPQSRPASISIPSRLVAPPPRLRLTYTSHLISSASLISSHSKFAFASAQPDVHGPALRPRALQHHRHRQAVRAAHGHHRRRPRRQGVPRCRGAWARVTIDHFRHLTLQNCAPRPASPVVR